MCSHTDKHARAQAQGHTLPPEMHKKDQRLTDMCAHTHRRGTHKDTRRFTHIHIHTQRQACTHVSKLEGTETLKKYTNRI